MYDTEHPVYSKLQAIGKEITQKVKPKAILVWSAHYEGEPDVIEINTSETTDLIYEFVSPAPPSRANLQSQLTQSSFYGFPAHYYREVFPNKGSPAIAQKVISALTIAGIKTQGLRRGLDHGVFASFKVAFNPDTNPLNIPIVQVSLFASESGAQHLALGRAVSSLREEGICLVMSGMAVHNLRDMRFGFASTRPYTKSFDEALRAAVEDGEEGNRDEKMEKLLERSDARGAHPSFEHLLPVFVGVGAAGGDRGKRLWTLAEGSFSWAQFRWGEIAAEG